MLAALGLAPARALATLRLCPGAETWETDPGAAAAALITAWRALTAG